MADSLIGKANADIHRSSSDGQKCLRSQAKPSLKDIPSPDETAPNARLDASIVPPGATQQGARKLPPALQRMKDSILSRRVDALKARLAIDNKYCGATTLKGTTCRVPTPTKDAGVITPTLQGLADMTQSSEELDRTLEGLVRMVHCHHHFQGPSSDTRVGAWVDTFSPGPEFHRSPVVLARKMRKALGTVSIDCTGRNMHGMPCGAPIGGRRVQSCQRSIDELVKEDDDPDPAAWELLLSVLEASRYCRFHPPQASMQIVRQWSTELLRIHRDTRPSRLASGDTSPVFAKPKHVALTLSRRSEGLQDKIDAILKKKHLSHQAFAPDPLPWLTSELLDFWLSEPDTTPLKVVLYGGSRAYRDPFQRSLHDILMSPLDAEDREDGHVYAYAVEGSPGFVKIGYTGRSVGVRHAEWTDDCNRTATPLYPLEDDSVELVPNARRIEALCHAGLHEYRRRIYCSACRRQHIEWFEVAADTAVQAIRECTLWMKQNPSGTSREGGMVLRAKGKRSFVHEQSFWTMVSMVGSLSLKD